MNAIAFRRIYVDLPADVDALLAARAKDAGMSKKAYLAQLIESDANAASVAATKAEEKAHGKGSKKRR